MSIIWVIISLVVTLLNFIPNKFINTNCRYIYIGSLVIITGALVGLSNRPVIAASIVLLGIVVVVWAAMRSALKRKETIVLNKD